MMPQLRNQNETQLLPFARLRKIRVLIFTENEITTNKHNQDSSKVQTVAKKKDKWITCYEMPTTHKIATLSGSKRKESKLFCITSPKLHIDF
jgi:hypothetical protein